MVKDFLFSRFNREFLIFMFFLVLSFAYWLMSVLNETRERDFFVKVHLVNVPRNIIIVDDTIPNLKVTIRDKGYYIAAYYYGNMLDNSVPISFANNANNKEKLVITASELQKAVQTILYKSSRVVAIKPDHLDVNFNFGQYKRVPVRILSSVKTNGSHYIAKTNLSPDSVTIYASHSILDSIKVAYTKAINLNEVKDSAVMTIPLSPVKGAKIVPAYVKAQFFPDVLTEAHLNVPISAINVPEGKILRMFPSQVTVSFAVGASHYKNIKKEHFTVVADYLSTRGGLEDKIVLKLITAPKDVRNPKISPEQVSYLIEK